MKPLFESKQPRCSNSSRHCLIKHGSRVLLLFNGGYVGTFKVPFSTARGIFGGRRLSTGLGLTWHSSVNSCWNSSSRFKFEASLAFSIQWVCVIRRTSCSSVVWHQYPGSSLLTLQGFIILIRPLNTREVDLFATQHAEDELNLDVVH